MRIIDRVLFGAAALFISWYFWSLAGDGLHAYFSGDDLMNLGLAASKPAWILVKSNLLFFSGDYRPMGAAWYRLIYEMGGFDALPFHVANFGILLFNLFATYSIARRLSSSREIGALCALLVSYHAHYSGLYYDTGNIYEVLAYCFYFSSFWLYVRIRQEGRYCTVLETAVLCGLYVCALNSKESGVSLPLALGVYELVYHRPASWRVAAFLRWVGREGRGALISGVLAAAFVIGKTVVPGSLASQSGYSPVFTLERWLDTNRNFLDHLAYQVTPWFTPSGVIITYSLLFFFAAVTRVRVLGFAAPFVIVASLPVAFIVPRAATAYYIALFGWALYGAAAAVTVTSYVLEKIRWGASFWASRIKATALFLGVALALSPLHRFQGAFAARSVTEASSSHRVVLEQVRKVRPTLKPRARLFFLVDPARPGWLNLTFLLRLNYHDPLLWVDDCARGPTPDLAALRTYDHIFDYREGHVVEVSVAEAHARLPECCPR